MSETIGNHDQIQQDAAPDSDGFGQEWGDNAPRGGRTVMGRILKDGAKVPLFLGQTLVKSLRDLGYNNTTSALCEHVDNAIQWGATEIRVYFHQTGKKGEFNIDTLVLDNGKGMAPHVLKVATSFGGSMVYDNRRGIGRYGMGMKAAALSMSHVMELYSWQERNAIYSMVLDVEEVGNNRSNLIELPDPTLIEELPSEILDILTNNMVFPKHPEESQTILARDVATLRERLGESGTIVFMPNCDRLTYRKAQTLVEHATKEMGRIYRNQLHAGTKLYVNNRLVEPFDPTYWLTSSRHTKVEGIGAKQSRLIRSWQIPLPIAENCDQTAIVAVRLFALPYEEWGQLPRSVIRNSLRVYDDHIVSYMRNNREVHVGPDADLLLPKHHTNNWLRLQIDFGGELDEAFGVAANKQGVRPKDYVYKIIIGQIGDEVQNLRQAITRSKSEQAAMASGSKLSEAERRANEADALQGKALPSPSPETEDEKVILEQNLRGLAIALKRAEETDEQAFDRVKNSKYITVFKHDEYWPFYHCDYKYGKVILTINTAHSFFKKLWEPLSEVAHAKDAMGESDGEGVPVSSSIMNGCAEALIALQLLLHSLARTQSQMCIDDHDGVNRQLFEKLRREWSSNLETQLNAK